MAHGMLSMDLRKRLRYVPLVAAGVETFIGIVLLGGLTGLLWHVYIFNRWVKLSPSMLGLTADWLLWGVGFFVTLSPSLMVVVRRTVALDPVAMLTSIVLPALSLITVAFSHSVGATMLVGSGFLAAYTLVSSSKCHVCIDNGFALRMVCTLVFGLLSLVAACGAFSVLLWQQDFFFALVSGSSLAPTDAWLRMLAVDLETFYLARPLLTPASFILAAVAFIILFREPARGIVNYLFAIGRVSTGDSNSAPGYGRRGSLGKWLSYLALAGSLVLGTIIGLYPYTVAGVGGVLGSDSWFYIQSLGSIRSLKDAVPLLQTPRTVFIVLLFMVKVLTGFSAGWVVRFMPVLLSGLLALSSFVLVKEGTGRLPVAAFAALLSVVSAQTALGMSAGIINNWFALSVANFMFALIVRSLRLGSKPLMVGALAVSLILLVSYAFLWVVVIAELALVLVASILAHWGKDNHEWNREVGLLSLMLLGSILIPVALSFVVSPFLGFKAKGIDPSVWFTEALGYLTHVQPNLLGSVWGVFGEAFDFAGNRIDLPILTLLSLMGLLEYRSQRRSFSRIIASMVVVPIVVIVVISLSSASPYAPIWLTWRGLYIIPLYLTGALGVESIIRRVGGAASSWSKSQLAFAGTFAAYILLSHLSYSLRALELLIIVGSR